MVEDRKPSIINEKNKKEGQNHNKKVSKMIENDHDEEATAIRALRCFR